MNLDNLQQVPGEHHEGYDEVNGCFANVARMVRDKGGKAVMGWLVHDGGETIDYIHHCVWQKPDGRVVDVSPQLDPDISHHYGEPMGALRYETPFVADRDAKLVEGRPLLAGKCVPRRRKFKRYAELLNLAMDAEVANDWEKAKSLYQAADRERNRAHGDGRLRRSTINIETQNVYRGVDAEYWPFLSA